LGIHVIVEENEINKKIIFMKTIPEFVSYETVYILKSDLTEDTLLKAIEQYQGLLLERGAKNILIENRGRRQLKYPIKSSRDGVFIQMNYDANGEIVSLMEKSMKISDSILRYLTSRMS
jgi:small subunit ribosomal protein S6